MDGISSTELDPEEEGEDNTGLRQRVLKGGAFMVGRQMVSIALGVISALVVIRLIGPRAYGAYTAAFGIYGYVQNFGQTGIGIYLIRSAERPSKREYDAASTLLVSSGLVLATGLAFAGPLIGGWVKINGFQPLLAVLAFALPLQGLSLSAAAKLERSLDFRRAVMIEMGSQIASYVAVVPLVFCGFGPWALVAGCYIQQICACVGFLWASRYRPGVVWDFGISKKILNYSFGFTAADWVWQLRSLVNPLIVGHFLGAESVGQIGLGIRLLEMLTFARAIAWRLAVAALAKIQTDSAKLINATTQGMQLQILAVGPLLIAFGWVGDILMPAIFGQRWAPVMVLYPFLALSYLTNSAFNIHSSVLYVKHKTLHLAIFHSFHILLFAGAAWIATQRIGLVGYGWGEMAGLVPYALLNVMFVRQFGWPDYRIAMIWWIALAIGLFWHSLGPWALAAPFVGLLWPSSIRTLKSYAIQVMSRF